MGRLQPIGRERLPPLVGGLTIRSLPAQSGRGAVQLDGVPGWRTVPDDRHVLQSEGVFHCGDRGTPAAADLTSTAWCRGAMQ